ncbi:CRISPR-associated protein, Cse2 family [Actinokineospora spheciospongiae]|uniref:CRISPR-associated protein, Cse2 family n=1 Tax=Actinokineospora spheciospongiae TaxID=909613 RepID=W7J6D7_9PSEU|nr:type I-E CRISPR-associated protein Cse2/CasB [Actinokineospora spheciospongiae]EWC61634.1 CRISPR-associated protein, Cse2 family [Actinokineospora spheciospongiae]
MTTETTGTPGTPERTEELPARDNSTLSGIVGARATALQSGYLRKVSSSVAALAQLRRAVGKEPGSVPEILVHTLHPVFARGARSDEPTHDEIAAHHCLTLFALHQQSQAKWMHKRGVRLGAAMRQLFSPDSPPDNPVLRRFAMLSTADSPQELFHHLRGVAQLLRARRIPLDYGQLAQDLSDWQRGGDRRTRVVLAWGREFHFVTATDQA